MIIVGNGKYLISVRLYKQMSFHDDWTELAENEHESIDIKSLKYNFLEWK